MYTYEQDEGAHSYTLKQTLAQVMSGLSMDDIVELTLTDVPASAKVAPAAKSLFSHTAPIAAKSVSAHSVHAADGSVEKQGLDRATHHGAAHLRALQASPPVTSAVRASFKVLSFSSYTTRQLIRQLEQALASGALSICVCVCVFFFVFCVFR